MMEVFELDRNDLRSTWGMYVRVGKLFFIAELYPFPHADVPRRSSL